MEHPVRTLVVDDERGVRFFLEETLRREGHQVTAVSSGEEALQHLRDTPVDLVMLDLRLGGRTDGLRVLEAIRWRWPEAVVIILTAHGSLDSALAAIREGVDGYLLKPVEPPELRHAVGQALERRRLLARSRAAQAVPEVVEAGPFRMDLAKHTITVDGQPLDLTPQEWALMLHMVQNRQKVLSPEELVRVVRDYEPEDLFEARQIIKWYVHRLRRKVEPQPAKPRYILNVRGIGYTFGG